MLSAVGAATLRYAIAGALAVFFPIMLRSLLRSLAAPWRSWKKLEQRLRHAETYTRAAKKFGSGIILGKWLERNSMAIYPFWCSR